MNLHPARKKTIIRIGWVLLAVLLFGSGYAGWTYRPVPKNDPVAEVAENPMDPRLLYTGPFQYISPDVRYTSAIQVASVVMKRFQPNTTNIRWVDR